MRKNWIKVEADTLCKSEIMRMGKLCNVSTEQAFVAWFKLYSYFDNHTEDGFLPDLIRPVIDKESGVSGFAVALEDVGWIKVDERGITVADWELHNGKKAKRRAMEAKRKRKARHAKKDLKKILTDFSPSQFLLYISADI